MSLPTGTGASTIIHVSSPQFSVDEIVRFVDSSKDNIFHPGVFDEILIEAADGIVVIDAARMVSIRSL